MRLSTEEGTGIFCVWNICLFVAMHDQTETHFIGFLSGMDIIFARIFSHKDSLGTFILF